MQNAWPMTKTANESWLQSQGEHVLHVKGLLACCFHRPLSETHSCIIVALASLFPLPCISEDGKE